VKPDVAVPAAQALQAAHVAILRNLVSSAKEGDERTELQRLLTMVEKGESEKPVYTLKGSVNLRIIGSHCRGRKFETCTFH
jgi:hypothetical protein